MDAQVHSLFRPARDERLGRSGATEARQVIFSVKLLTYSNCRRFGLEFGASSV
jgi:hypothetical protein